MTEERLLPGFGYLAAERAAPAGPPRSGLSEPSPSRRVVL